MVDCFEQRSSTRRGRSLVDSEESRIRSLKSEIISPVIGFFGRPNRAALDAEGFAKGYLRDCALVPNIAVAVSGGCF